MAIVAQFLRDSASAAHAPSAAVPALSSAIPCAAFAPAVFAVADISLNERSAEEIARLRPSSAPSRATRREMRLAMSSGTYVGTFAVGAIGRKWVHYWSGLPSYIDRSLP